MDSMKMKTNEATIQLWAISILKGDLESQKEKKYITEMEKIR